MYLFLYQSITLLPTIHFLVTGLSLIILFISYYEIVLLERNVRKIKLGLFENARILSDRKRVISLYLKY